MTQIRLSLDEARHIGQAQSEIFALESLGFLLAGRGDYEGAETSLLCGIPLARAAGTRRYLAMMLCALAQVRLNDGLRRTVERGPFFIFFTPPGRAKCVGKFYISHLWWHRFTVKIAQTND